MNFLIFFILLSLSRCEEKKTVEQELEQSIEDLFNKYQKNGQMQYYYYRLILQQLTRMQTDQTEIDKNYSQTQHGKFLDHFVMKSMRNNKYKMVKLDQIKEEVLGSLWNSVYDDDMDDQKNIKPHKKIELTESELQLFNGPIKVDL